MLQRRLIRLSTALLAREMRLGVAESCTGGWLSKVCTDLAGSSQWFEAGLVTYSNAAKQTLLGVTAETLTRYGAVSEETVLEMAQGVLNRLPTVSIAFAVSGVAGPDGGTAEKPVGFVWFAWQLRNQQARTQCVQFSGNRDAVRTQSVQTMLEGALQLLEAE